MRKENFSLKLKIFFMQDRLGKLAPEHFQAVLKEVHPHSLFSF
jgi:Centrosomin N-terminal motif 1